jgi:hypothetical protein
MLSLHRILATTFALGAACAQPVAAPQAPAAASTRASCGDARAVSLTDEVASNAAFRQLRGLHRAPLRFSCPSDQPCSLPKDTQIEFSLEPKRPVACEFAACRVPYLGSLPFTDDPHDPCPKVLWSVFEVTLRSDGTTLDERATDVNVLASPSGGAYLRFTVDDPTALARAMQREAPRAAPQTTMLDVQLEIVQGRLRAQLSALAAPLPAAPATDLRFKAAWTATWELPPPSR